MAPASSPLASLHRQYRRGETTPAAQVHAALRRANRNAGQNVYLAQDAAWSQHEAARLRREDLKTQPLWGIPVSLKDCFDLAGFTTSCGSRFYRDRNGIATEDSAIAEKLRAAGAVITGKTHLHQIAYGITGENRDFGDCTQPRDAALLTGGSSSGAAASVQEGSAMAAIGTDTGGSIRVPAALCGLAGYRSSITLQDDLWRGGAHLAPSFDTLGWIYRDLADGPALARVFFDLPAVTAPRLATLRVGIPHKDFLHDCTTEVMATLQEWQTEFVHQEAMVGHVDTSFWGDAMEIFAPLQAHEASILHRGHFNHFEPAIAERLRWGASIAPAGIADLRAHLNSFRDDMDKLFDRFDFLLLPCSPMASLAAGADHSQTRARILRYTAPISLAGLPVVTLPGNAGGLQLVGRMGSDAELLAVSAELAEFSAAHRNDATLHP